MEELTNVHGMVTLIGVRPLRTLADNTRNATIVQKRTIEMNTSNVVLCQSCASSLHTKVTKAAMPEHRVELKMRKRILRE